MPINQLEQQLTEVTNSIEYLQCNFPEEKTKIQEYQNERQRILREMKVIE